MRRAGLLPLHRWLGLALAPFLLIQALTGALLVLHEATVPHPPPVMARTGQFVDAAQAALPGLRVTRLYLPGSTGPTAFAEMSGASGARAYAELDAATARPLATGALWRFPYRAAVQVHYRLASGTGGLAVVTMVGLALALSAASGVVFWWPGAGRLGQALKVRRSLAGHVRLRQWHRSVGAVAAMLALFSAATGLLLAVPDLSDALAPAAATGRAPVFASEAIDRAVAAAQALHPRAALRDVRFPAADRIDLNFDAPARNARAVHVVSVRPSDGAVVKAIAADDNPVLWMKVLALHTGETFGPAGLALLLAEAGALVFLAVAGVLMWLRRRRKGRA